MITQKELKEWLCYDKKTGIFTARKASRRNARRKGAVCGHTNKVGYCEITVNSKSYSAHGLAILYMYGFYPLEVDHLNHNKSDNSIDNLKVCSHTENQRNRPLFKNNKTGVAGVSFYEKKSKFYSYIQVNKKSISLGWYSTIFEAAAVRKSAELYYGFNENHGKSPVGRRVVPSVL